MQTKEKTSAPTQPEKPQLFTADIYVDKKIVSSVSVKAASAGAAQIACMRLIKVKVK